MPTDAIANAHTPAPRSVYIASLVYLIRPVVILLSFVVGVSAALLWTAQGVCLDANTTASNRGRVAGIFWASLMTGNVLGNLVASIILTDVHVAPAHGAHHAATNGTDSSQFQPGWHGGQSVLFLALAFAAFASIVSFSFIRPLATLSDAERDEEATGLAREQRQSLTSPPAASGSFSLAADDSSTGPRASLSDVGAWHRIVVMLGQLGKPQLWLLMWTFFYSGAFVSFGVGMFTRQSHSRNHIGYIMMTFSGGDAAGERAVRSRNLTPRAANTLPAPQTPASLVVGRLLHCVPIWLVFASVLPLQLAAAYAVVLASANQGAWFYIAAGILGWIDGVLQTRVRPPPPHTHSPPYPRAHRACLQLYPVVSRHFSHAPDVGYAWYKLVQACGAGTLFLLSPLFVNHSECLAAISARLAAHQRPQTPSGPPRRSCGTR